MKKVLLVVVVMSMFAVTDEASAWPRVFGRRSSSSVSVSRFSGGPQSVAEQKAQIMASRRIHGHIGGGYGGGNAEGTGFSSVSATAALNNCCFTGKRTLLGSACVKGSNGWYAVKIFR